jgi:cytochrome c oxidase subunit 2
MNAMSHPASIFAPMSTPAHSIDGLSRFVMSIAALIFVVVVTLLAYAIIRFRQRQPDDGREPPQVYGSSEIEMAWTVIPCLIVLVLFLAAARVIATIQNVATSPDAIEITVVGHQFWWESGRYWLLARARILTLKVTLIAAGSTSAARPSAMATIQSRNSLTLLPAAA